MLIKSVQRYAHSKSYFSIKLVAVICNQVRCDNLLAELRGTSLVVKMDRSWKKLSLIFFGTLCVLCFYPQPTLSQRSIDPEIQHKIDDYILNTFFPLGGTSGLGLTIVQNDGEILYTTGYGLAHRDTRIPNGNSTQFMVGSISKSVTALLSVKILHELFPDLGEAVLDTPIRKLIPQENLTLIDRFRSEHATVRDLLSHRLCLYNDDMALQAEPYESAQENVYRLRYNDEFCGFRSEFIYSNPVYSMAGELLAVLGGKSFEDLAQDFLNEIGMVNSTFVSLSDDFEQMPNRALPYYVLNNVTYPFNSELAKRMVFINAAGGFISTPDDMALYIRFNLNKGNINERQIIPREVMEWVVKPSNMVPQFTFKESDEQLILSTFGYGLGFFLSSYDGWNYVEHAGGNLPYQSLISLYPEKNLGIYSSVHVGPLKIDQKVLHAFIFDTLRGLSKEDALSKALKLNNQIRKIGELKKKAANKESTKVVAGKLPMKKQNQDIVGLYGSGNLGPLEVTERFNEAANTTQKYMSYGKWFKGWLTPTEENGRLLHKLTWDTDIYQDDIVFSEFGTEDSYLVFDDDDDDIVHFSGIVGLKGVFRRGLNVDLDQLPPVPWHPESCGPETA